MLAASRVRVPNSDVLAFHDDLILHTSCISIVACNNTLGVVISVSFCTDAPCCVKPTSHGVRQGRFGIHPILHNLCQSAQPHGIKTHQTVWTGDEVEKKVRALRCPGDLRKLRFKTLPQATGTRFRACRQPEEEAAGHRETERKSRLPGVHVSGGVASSRSPEVATGAPIDPLQKQKLDGEAEIIQQSLGPLDDSLPGAAASLCAILTALFWKVCCISNTQDSLTWS